MAPLQQNIKLFISSLYQTIIRHKKWASTSLIIFCLLIAWLSVYLGSAYWTAYQLKKQLLNPDISQLEQHIPAALLLPYQAKALSKPLKHDGLGQRYLNNVWPQIIQQQNLYQLLLLQADANREQSTSTDFTDFPNTFRLNWGEADRQIWLQWQRKSWRTWQLTALCFYNPHPVADIKNCESSNR
jgi:hypothetical protein